MQNDTQATTEQLLEMANARIRDLENILTACREYGDEHRLRADRLQELYDDTRAEADSYKEKHEMLKARLGYEESEVSVLRQQITALARDLEIADLNNRLEQGDG
jgi:Mg2+/Co2+ transporter CorB